MLDVLTLTGPVYLLIGIGYLAGRLRLFGAGELRVIGRFVLTVCLPALLFGAVARRRFDEVLDGTYLLAYASGSLAVLAFGVAWALWRRRAPISLAALQGMGMSSSNSGFLGYPILQQVLGAPAATVLALTLLVENLIVLPLAIALADAGGHGSVRRAFAQAAKGLLRHPLVLAIAAGLVFALAGWRLPQPIERTVQLVGAAAAPVALFVVGGMLVGIRLEGVRGDLARIAVGKLLLHPLAVLAALLLLPPVDPALRTGALVLAAMPMLGIYPVLAQKHHHERFCAAALLVTTVLSFFTTSVGLWWLRQHPGWLP